MSGPLTAKANKLNNVQRATFIAIAGKNISSLTNMAGPAFAPVVKSSIGAIGSNPALVPMAIQGVESIPFLPDPVKKMINTWLDQALGTPKPPPSAPSAPAPIVVAQQKKTPWLLIGAGVVGVGVLIMLMRKKK